DLVHVQAPHDAAGQGVEQLVVDQLLGVARVAVGTEGDEQGPPVQGARVDVALVAEQCRRIHPDLQGDGPRKRRTVTSSPTSAPVTTRKTIRTNPEPSRSASRAPR